MGCVCSHAFGTLKLLFEDLRFGNAASLVASLFVLRPHPDPDPEADSAGTGRTLTAGEEDRFGR